MPFIFVFLLGFVGMKGERGCVDTHIPFLSAFTMFWCTSAPGEVGWCAFFYCKKDRMVVEKYFKKILKHEKNVYKLDLYIQ